MVLHFGPYTFVYSHPTISPAISVLSIGIAFMGAYMTICFAEQYRLQKLGNGSKSKLLTPLQVFLLLACAKGGVKTWAMNYINIFGMKLWVNVLTPPLLVPINYLEIPTFLSLGVAVAFAGIGLYIGAQDKMFAKTKQQIVEQFVAHSSKLSFKEIQNITNMKMLMIMATQSLQHILIGGIVCGTGTIVTVCLSFNAIKIEYNNVVYNPGVIAGCTVLSWTMCILCFWMLFRLLSLYPHIEWLRISSAGLMAFNVFIVRYIMQEYAIVFHVVTDINAAHTTFKDTRSMSQSQGFSGTIIASVIFCFIMVLIGFGDLRAWLYSKSARAQCLETLIENLRKESTQNNEIITAYLRRHDKILSLTNEAHNSSVNNHTSSKVAEDYSNTTFSGRVLSFMKRFFTLNSVAPSEDGGDSRNCSQIGDLEGGSRSLARTENKSPSASLRKFNQILKQSEDGTPCETPAATDLEAIRDSEPVIPV